MWLSKNVVFWLFPLFLTTLSAVEVVACTCAGPRSFKPFQPCGVFWSAEVIFIGTAEKVSIIEFDADGKPISATGGMGRRTDASKDGNEKRMVVKFSVEKAIRGIEGKTVEVETSPSGASCGYPFKEGERYFAYLQRGKDGKLTEHLCGPTVLLKDGAADLEYLRAVENGEVGGRVFGTVFQMSRKSFKDQGEYLPVAGMKITLKSVKVRYADKRKAPKYKKINLQTQTDENGFYLFREVPANSYTVQAAFQSGLRQLHPSEDLTAQYVTIDEEKRRCGGANFSATTQASIEGRIVGSNGQPPPSQYVSLIPVDENGKIYIDEVFAGVSSDRETGRFYFNLVPPGKYVAAINPKTCLNRDKSAFGKLFLPGVGSQTEAAIISVAENERKITPDFRVLPLKERTFSGRVLSAVKVPLNGVKVFIIDEDAERCIKLGGLTETRTDEFGNFQIMGYEGYKYKVRAYADKLSQTYSKFIDIPAFGNFENLEIIMSKEYFSK